MKCKTCKHWFDNGTDYSSCDRDALLRESDFFCAAWEEEPIERVITVRESPTNADRIRAMSDEGLARFIANQRGKYCDFKDPSEEEYPKVLYWLRSPVEVEDGT